MHGRKYRNAAQTCDLVFVNSEYTANDAAELLAIPRERIYVAHPGVSEAFTPEGERADFGRPYVLAVATLEPRKNVARLVQAFELVRADHPELDLVVAGAEVTWAPSPLAGTSVRGLGFVPDTELPALYRGAAVRSCIRRCSRASASRSWKRWPAGRPSSPPRILRWTRPPASAAIRVDPESPEAIADGIRRAFEERESLVSKGLEHAKRFTWRACGEAHLHGFRTD